MVIAITRIYGLGYVHAGGKPRLVTVSSGSEAEVKGNAYRVSNANEIVDVNNTRGCSLDNLGSLCGLILGWARHDAFCCGGDDAGAVDC